MVSDSVCIKKVHLSFNISLKNEDLTTYFTAIHEYLYFVQFTEQNSTYPVSKIEVLSMKMAAETLPDEHHLHFHSPAWAILPSHHS